MAIRSEVLLIIYRIATWECLAHHLAAYTCFTLFLSFKMYLKCKQALWPIRSELLLTIIYKIAISWECQVAIELKYENVTDRMPQHF